MKFINILIMAFVIFTSPLIAIADDSNDGVDGTETSGPEPVRTPGDGSTPEPADD